MSAFHDTLKTRIKASGYDYRTLSLKIGQGERYISNLLSSKSDPGYSNVIKICAALGLTPNQLAGLNDEITLLSDEADAKIVSAQAERFLTAITRETHRKLTRRGVKPLLDDVLTWWHRQNGYLNNFDGLAEHVDLYLAPTPDSRMPEPYRIGHDSLATRAFDLKSAEHLRYLMSTFDEELIRRVHFAHVEATKGEPKLSIETNDVDLPGHTFPLRFTYKRLLLPVKDQDENAYVLNFSQAIE